MRTIYKIHRRVNTPVEFRGLKGRYIYYGAAAVIGELFLFALLYLTGLNSWICISVCTATGTLSIAAIFQVSARYGEYGWRKKQTAKRLPKTMRCKSRNYFINLKN